MFKFSEREFGTRGTFNPLSAVADELFECVWPFCGVWVCLTILLALKGLRHNGILEKRQ